MIQRASTLLLLGAAAALAACGETTPKAESPAAEKSMAMPATAVSGRGTGTVTAVDKTAGKVTIDHGPIPEANWGAMTMEFEAEPAMLETVTIGDKVEFGMTMSGATAKVTSITRK